ncbi:MAG: phosphoribosylglycinamide formyltransferase [SAR86 cluster bacterium]|nr:phosphoribosylglycinamide formyltransferase [SAR86 cluster bacterium]
MFKIIVLISGNGSNLQAIIDSCKSGMIGGNVVGVISNKANVFGLERAKKNNIPSEVINHNNFGTREEFDQELVTSIRSYQPDLIVLAGFMRILSPIMTSAFKNKMINIHPSLLPKYPGLKTHEQVIANNDAEHGVTIHSVSEELDGGPIIAQSKIVVHKNQQLEDLIERIHKIEHKIFPKVISMIASEEIKIVNVAANKKVIYENYEI